MNLRIATPLALFALVAPAVPAAASHTTGSVSSNGCAALKQKANKAAKSGKKSLAKRLKLRYKTCKSEATIRTALAGYTFTGTRGDGEPVTATLCQDGSWATRIGSSPAAVSSGTTWVVRYPSFTSATKWVAQVAEFKDRAKGGWSIGFARSGDSFQYGVASFDTVTDLGPVTRTPAGAACA